MVARDNGDGTFVVLFADGDKDTSLALRHMKPDRSGGTYSAVEQFRKAYAKALRSGRQAEFRRSIDRRVRGGAISEDAFVRAVKEVVQLLSCVAFMCCHLTRTWPQATDGAVRDTDASFIWTALELVNAEEQVDVGTLLWRSVADLDRPARDPDTEEVKYHKVSSGAAKRLQAKFQSFVDKGLVRSFREIFDMADADRSGTISFSEFQQAVKDVARSDPSVNLTNRELEEVWSVIDVDRDDAVEYNEFKAFCEGSSKATKRSSRDPDTEEVKYHKVSSGAAKRLQAKFQSFVDKGLVRSFREIFDMADADRSGTISFSEFQQAVQDVARSDPSVRMRNRELEEVWSVIDVDRDDAVAFREFRAFCEGGASNVKYHDVSSEAADRLRRKFKGFVDKGLVRDFREIFDMADTDRSGTISFSEFQQAVQDVARSDPSVRMRNRELEEVWSVMDVDRDDAVAFREFRAFCEAETVSAPDL